MCMTRLHVTPLCDTNASACPRDVWPHPEIFDLVPMMVAIQIFHEHSLLLKCWMIKGTNFCSVCYSAMHPRCARDKMGQELGAYPRRLYRTLGIAHENILDMEVSAAQSNST